MAFRAEFDLSARPRSQASAQCQPGTGESSLRNFGPSEISAQAPWLFARNSICRPVRVAKPVPNASLGRNFRTVVFDDDDDELFSPEDLRLVLRVIVKDLGLWESANTELRILTGSMILSDRTDRLDFDVTRSHRLVRVRALELSLDDGVLDKIRLDRALGQVDTVLGDGLLEAARHGRHGPPQTRRAWTRVLGREH
ncbi:hypothetical protein T492DRAFT_1040526, partial [Pavlovales sp. CCMP2436]